MIDLSDLKEIDLNHVNKSTLVDRSVVKVNPDVSREERISSYIEQIKNPYCYLDGNTVVKISFSNSDTTMEDCIANYLKGI